jgi:serine/threonine protein kinase
MDSCDDDHLLRMTDYLGPLPKRLTARWSRSSKYFRDDGELFNTMISGPPGISDRFGPLENLFKQHKSDEIGEEEERLVLDLLRHVLRYEPEERPSAEDLLKHPWFQSEV